MKLTQIQYKNFKGGSGCHALTGVTFVHGDNRRGKTRVFEAAILALTGQLPGVGSQPHVLHAALASGDDMMVSATGGDGSVATRTYTKKRDSVKTAELFRNWTAASVPTVMFAPTEFLIMSDRRRVAWLSRVLPPPSLDKVGPDAIISNLKNFRADPHTPQHEAAVNLLCDMVRLSCDESKGDGLTLGKWLDAGVSKNCLDKKWARDYLADGDAAAKPTVQDWLAVLGETVRNFANAAKAEADRMAKTILGVTQLREDPESLPRAEQRKRAAEQTLRTATEAKAACAERWKAAKHALDADERVAASYVAPEQGAMERLEAAAAELRVAATVTLTAPEPVKPTPTNELRKAANDAVQRRQENERDVRLARHNIETIEAKLKAAEHAKNCPTCGQSIEEHQKEVAAGYRKELKAAKAALAEHEKRMASLAAAEAVALGHLNDAEKANDILAEKEAAAWRDYKGAVAKRDEKAQLLRVTEGQIKSLKDGAAKAEPARLAAERLPRLRQELADIQARGEELKADLEKAQAAVTEADAALRKAVQDGATAKQVRLAGEQVDKAKAEETVAKALSGMLAELSALVVEQSVAPLMEQANALFEPVLGDKLVYQDGDIGYMADGRLVPWRTFSGAERAVGFAALGVALAAKSGIKLAVVDELGNVDEARKRVLLRTLCGLVKAGRIDQAIVVDVQEPPQFVLDGHDETFSTIYIK